MPRVLLAAAVGAVGVVCVAGPKCWPATRTGPCSPGVALLPPLQLLATPRPHAQPLGVGVRFLVLQPTAMGVIWVTVGSHGETSAGQPARCLQ